MEIIRTLRWKSSRAVPSSFATRCAKSANPQATFLCGGDLIPGRYPTTSAVCLANDDFISDTFRRNDMWIGESRLRWCSSTTDLIDEASYRRQGRLTDPALKARLPTLRPQVRFRLHASLHHVFSQPTLEYGWAL
jgi:hypothetical protein